MKILLVSYYFPPDLCAGAFRAKALADALIRQGNGRVQLDVLTTEPNRYRSHQPGASDGIDVGYRVVRAELPHQRWGLAGQVRSFATFARAAASRVPESRYDVVVATSSRLMTAALGARLAKAKGAKYYLDIRDIFTDTVTQVFNPGLVVPIRGLLSSIEQYSVNRADRINLVSPGFLPYFRAKCGEKDYRLFTNGIDDGFSLRNCSVDRAAQRKVRILYAGNIGKGQGLERILPDLAFQLADRAEFTVVGDGATRPLLIRKCREAGAPIRFVDPVPRDQLLQYYDEADVLFLHLNDLSAFLKVLPSKLFEYVATGKPILAGVDGYCKEFLSSQVDGVELFRPCDVDSALRAFQSLDLASYPRKNFCERYSRKRIMDHMARDILELGLEVGTDFDTSRASG